MLDPNRMPPKGRRRAVFAALVAAQDRTRSLRAATLEVLAEFGLSRVVVERIEREGMNNEWPPLDEAGYTGSDVALRQFGHPK